MRPPIGHFLGPGEWLLLGVGLGVFAVVLFTILVGAARRKGWLR